jgi:hypothetical protein
VTCGSGGSFIDINRIGLPDGLREKEQSPFFDLYSERRKFVSDLASV